MFFLCSHLLTVAMFGKAEENREKKEEHDDADPSHRDDISHFPNSHSLLQAGTCAWKSQCGILKNLSYRTGVFSFVLTLNLFRIDKLCVYMNVDVFHESNYSRYAESLTGHH